MRYFNYILLGISICITIFLFILSANQIDLIPYQNNAKKSEQIMFVEKSTDLNQLKILTEDIIEQDDQIFKESSFVSARINTWLILLFILQILMGIIFFIQYKRLKSKQ